MAKEIIVEEAGYEESGRNRGMGILCYLSLLLLVPLFVSKDSRFVRFHENQGLVLLVLEIVWGVAFRVAYALLSWLPLIGTLLSIAGWVVDLVFVLLSIVGIVNVVNGRCKELPVIGGIRLLK